jgi:hypothetical protein
MTPRTDHRIAALIALALFLRHMVGHNAASSLLVRHGLPLATVRRVLSTSRRRCRAGPADPAVPF